MKHDRFLQISSIMLLIGFVPLAWWARKHPHPPLDVGTTRALQHKHIQVPILRSTVLLGNTITGSAIVLNLLAFPVALLFWKRQLRVEALMTVGISWTSTLVRTIIKGLVDRPRPERRLVRVISRSSGTSFPSGHVTSTLSFWGWLLAWTLLQRKEAPSWKQSGLASLSGLCILLVGPSRIYLGEHWLTDVLGGYLFGAGWLGLGLQFYLRMHKAEEKKKI